MKKLTLVRSFPSPIEKVWDALTDTDKLKQRWAPTGLETSYISVDLRQGGLFGYCFKSPEGQEFWGRGIYQVIEEPKFLSWMKGWKNILYYSFNKKCTYKGKCLNAERLHSKFDGYMDGLKMDESYLDFLFHIIKEEYTARQGDKELVARNIEKK